MPDSLGSDFTDDDLRTALESLSEEPNWARVGVTQRARARRRNRRLTVAAAIVAFGAGTFAVIEMTRSDENIPIATETTTAEATTTTSLVPSKARDDVHLEIWPTHVPVGVPAEITAVLVNDSDDVVPFCEGPSFVVRNGSRLDEPAQSLPPCVPENAEYILPGDFSHEWKIRVPALHEGIYTFESGATLQAYPGLPYGDAVPAEDHTVRFAGADAIGNGVSMLPDELVVLGGNRLAIRWTTPCNEPAHDVTFSYLGSVWNFSEVEVELHVPLSGMTCYAPGHWSTVIDLPTPLQGARVFASLGDLGGGSSTTVVGASRVEAWPLGEPLPALATMDREPVAILGATSSPGWISVRPYDGCGNWVARPIVDANTMYVQAYVPADNESCEGNPTPTLGFSVEPGRVYNVFGARECPDDGARCGDIAP